MRFVNRIGRHVRRRAGQAANSTLVPFEVKVRLQYWRAQRSWPSRQPSTFNQKVRWKMLKDRRPLLTTFADKVAARDYVARAVGPEVLTECYAVVADPAELESARLPREFVVKPTHGSGGVWIVTDRTPPDATAPRPGTGWRGVITSPDEHDWDGLRATCRQWLALNYAHAATEWAYLHVPPRIMVEELLTAPYGTVPAIDYKFFVFHGRVRLVEVDTGRYTGHRRSLFLPDWTPLEAQLKHPPADLEIPRPGSLERMIEVAERLGQETDFVRVDLYDLAGRVVFGELTNYPEAGLGDFTPASFDAELGRFWAAPKTYR